jgi:hypothetical protein
VKPSSGDDTWSLATRENTSLPGRFNLKFKIEKVGVVLKEKKG